MLRDKNLIPLSHQHQHALALCVRIDRASPIGEADLGAWRAEITQLFQTEIGIHFTAEERVLFPVARRFRELIPLVEDLVADHAVLRESFSQAQELSAANMKASAQLLATHVRKEERQLFEGLQVLMGAEELDELGKQLAVALKDAEQACLLPSEATRLRPAK
jgi:iron-sulfur cluster repair protein YtfE (RIC family)